MSATEAPIEPRQLNPETVASELDVLSRGVDAASTKLARLTKEMEGTANSDGEYVMGPGLEYELRFNEELTAIAVEAGDKRPPAEDIRTAMAHTRVRTKYPDLADNYRRITTEMKALQMWLSSQKASMNARQSVLNACRDLSGSKH